MRGMIGLGMVALGLWGCGLRGDEPKDSAPSASGVSNAGGLTTAVGGVNAAGSNKGTGSGWSSGAAKPANTGAAAPVVGGGSGGGGDGLWAALNGRPQQPGTKPSETIRDAGGVFMGLPSGWTTDDTNKIDPTLGYGANLGGCVMFYPSKNTTLGRTDTRARLCAVMLETIPAMAGRTAASLELYSFYMSMDKVEWTPWTDGTVGDGFKAKLSKGTSGSKESFAAYVEVPGKKNIFVMGRWASEEEKGQVLDIVRGLGTCTFTPDKRKCTPDKPY